MKCLTLFLLALFSLHHPLTDTCEVRHDWKLKKVTDGIEVYTRDVTGSNLKELKIKMVFEQTRLSAIMAVLSDSRSYGQWMYKCLEGRTVENNNFLNTKDYFKLDFPWPLSDRDLYTSSVITQDTMTKVLRIGTIALKNYEKEEGVVRIDNHSNTWLFTPLAGGDVRLVYTVRSDPGGNIPDWLVNLAIDKGPTNTMKNLRKMVLKEKYSRAQLSWIID